MPDFDQLNAEWTPPGRESRVDWLARHGAKKDVYDETLSLVKRCKTTMLKQEGYKVSRCLREGVKEVLYTYDDTDVPNQ